MSYSDRKEIIASIENSRDSHLVVYVTGDRNPILLHINEDAVRPLYEHLLQLSKSERRKQRIDLFLYSRGGDISVPWRIVSMFREFCGEFNVLIPYKAHSAATMIALGADHIVMGRKAELGPIDPSLYFQSDGKIPPEISVEDVNAYVSFMQDRVNITDQHALAQLIALLAGNVTPLMFGKVSRTDSHIESVARKLLMSHKEKPTVEQVQTIIDTLTRKTYFHGHAIGRSEANELGLSIEKAPEILDEMLWNLYLQYEELLDLTDTIVPDEVLFRNQSEQHDFGMLRQGVIESTTHSNLCEVHVELQRLRQTPTNVSFSPNIVLPQGLVMAPDLQQILQIALQQILLQFQQELVRQAPIVGVQIRSFGGKWRNNSEDV